MKRTSLFTLLAIILVTPILFNSCVDTCTESMRWVYYEPIYRSLEDIRSGIVQKSQVRAIHEPGRLYYLGSNMLINQPGEGIHIIDNSDPSAPVYRSFLEIPGNFDLAGTGNYLYVDSYVDLVVLDLSDISNITEVKRIEGFFPDYNSFGFYVDDEKGVVTGWQEVETFETFESNCDGNQYVGPWWGYRGGIAVDFAMAESSSFNPGSNPGVGGSLAKFTIAKDHLYMIDASSDLHAAYIGNPTQPVLLSKVNLGLALETLFPYGNHLFVGSTSGMLVVDITSPGSPEHISTFAHVTSCDPVVVEGDYAFVTLRDGTICRNGSNQLDVIDISDRSDLDWIASYPMYNPGGLGIDNDVLFICDGLAGLKVYDASDKMKITDHPIAFYPDLLAIDVIPYNGILMAIADDGFYQYDYSDINNIVLLSKIAFSND